MVSFLWSYILNKNMCGINMAANKDYELIDCLCRLLWFMGLELS